MERYEPAAIEEKWQRVWDDARAFNVPNPEPGARRTRASPTCSRCSRTRPASSTWATCATTRSATCSRTSAGATASTVLRPMGFDSFGLPAENAAIKEGGHPRVVTERNIAHIRGPVEAPRLRDRLGPRRSRRTSPSTTAGRSGSSSSFFERGLAYRKEAPVNWCPNDQTVLANEQVIDGRCERCGAEVEREEPDAVVLPDHRLRRRAARRDGRARVWPERVLTMQRNWIGRSEGAEVDFRIEERDRDAARLHDAARHAVRRHVLRARARASARRASSSPAREHEATVRDYVAQDGGARAEERAAARRRTASSPAATSSTRSTASGCRSGSPTTC